jgi:hypothetical protein
MRRAQYRSEADARKGRQIVYETRSSGKKGFIFLPRVGCSDPSSSGGEFFPQKHLP